ncbi:MAG: DUF1178 family protein [Methyloligellaceae bacterium]
MIRYSLRCEKSHEFEIWFRNSSDYDRQAARGDVVCPRCGSERIAKAPMSPRVARAGKSAKSADGAIEDLRRARDKLLKHADKVGDEFPREARKIHYKESEPRGIYGRATDDEAEALREEGVDFYPLPPLPEDYH